MLAETWEILPALILKEQTESLQTDFTMTMTFPSYFSYGWTLKLAAYIPRTQLSTLKT